MGQIKPRKDGTGWYYEDDELTTAPPSYTETTHVDIPTNIQQGWICPKCGRANAPWASVCPCYMGNIAYKITWTRSK